MLSRYVVVIDEFGHGSHGHLHMHSVTREPFVVYEWVWRKKAIPPVWAQAWKHPPI